LLILIVASVIGLAIVALGFTIFAEPGSRDFPPGSAEARVDEFIQSLASGDRISAHEMLSSNSRTRCPLTRFRPNDYDDIAEARVTIESVLEIKPDIVEITTTVAHIEVSFPSANERSSNEYFVLERDAGKWLIDEHSWPRTGCPVPNSAAYHPEDVPARAGVGLES